MARFLCFSSEDEEEMCDGNWKKRSGGAEEVDRRSFSSLLKKNRRWNSSEDEEEMCDCNWKKRSGGAEEVDRRSLKKCKKLKTKGKKVMGNEVEGEEVAARVEEGGEGGELEEEEEEVEERGGGGEVEEEEEVEEGGEGGEDEEEEQGNEGSSSGKENNAISVRIDSDVLDCSVCYEPLLPPLFQCHNGHVTCSSCYGELQNKCHVCFLPTGNSRCRALETVIEAIKIPCPHSTFGCREIIPYIKKDTHKELCPFAPCSCPVSSCTFWGRPKLLLGHIQKEHHSTTPMISFFYNRSFEVALQKEEPFFVLHGKDGRIFLLLNECNTVPYGNCLSIACMRPGSTELDLRYKIMVKGKGSELHLKASPKNIRELKVGSPAGSFLCVPHEVCDLSGELSIDVLIRKT